MSSGSFSGQLFLYLKVIFSGMFQWLDVGRRQLGAEGAAGSDVFPVAGRRAGLGAVLSAVSALQVCGKEYN